MKKVDADTTLVVSADCPHCGALNDLTSELLEYLNPTLTAMNIDFTCTCNDCGKEFMIVDINH